MARFVALIRGINVGGTGKLPMADLRDLMDGLGWTDVQTYIQSGNAVFSTDGTADALGQALSDAIEKRFGFRRPVLVLSAPAFGQALAANPYAEEAARAPKSVHLFFLLGPARAPDLDALEALRAPDERFALMGNVLYLNAPSGIGRSKLAAKIDRHLGVGTTARNYSTFRALADMM